MEQRSGRTHVRVPSVDSDHDLYQNHLAHAPQGNRRGRPKDNMRASYPQPPLTPNAAGSLPPTSLPQPIANPLLPSAPASPPTPAPSPTPHHRSVAAMWSQKRFAQQEAEDCNEPILREFCAMFGSLSAGDKERWMLKIVDTLDNHMLHFVKQLVSPRLKKDPFTILPNELCFKVRVL